MYRQEQALPDKACDPDTKKKENMISPDFYFVLHPD